MIEGLTVLGIFAVLLGFAAGGAFGGTEALFLAAAAIIAGGLLFAVAAGSVYHGLLYRALAAGDHRPAGWWRHPVRHHDRIPKEERRRVMVWFHAGAAGFFVTLAGCALMFLWIVLY